MNGAVLTFTFVNNAVPRRIWPWRARRGQVPPTEGRTYLHPSELPNFDALISSPPEQRPRRFTVSLVGVASLALLVGSSLLYSTNRSEAKTTSLPAHTVTRVNDVPHLGRRAATSVIEIASLSNSHLQAAGAIIVGNGDTAVTTLDLARGSSVFAIDAGGRRDRGRVMGHDRHLGLTYVHLSRPHHVTSVADPIATMPVLALSPYMSSRSSKPLIAYASTVLSDPRRTNLNGIVGYLSATSPDSLHALSGSVAVADSGRVVAIYSGTAQWLAAGYVASVASAWLARSGCHGSLGITAVDAEGGGVSVSAVTSHSTAHVLHPGDVITALNQKPIGSLDELLADLYAMPGRIHVVIQYTRDSAPGFGVVRLGCTT